MIGNNGAAREAANGGASSNEIARHIEAVAHKLLGEPNRGLSTKTELRFGTNGSLSVNLEKGTWFSHEDGEGGGVLDLIARETGGQNGEALVWLRDKLGIVLDDRPPATGSKPRSKVTARYVYRDERGAPLYRVLRLEPKRFSQERRENGAWIGGKGALDGVRRVLFRLPELLAAGSAETVLLVEGEKDALTLVKHGFIATTSAQGASNWHKTDSSALTGRHVVIVPDHDAAGAGYEREAAQDLAGRTSSLRVLRLPIENPSKACNDVTDWFEQCGGTRKKLLALIEAAPPYQPQSPEWPDPEELQEAADEPAPFPIAALPPDAKAAVVEYQAYGQQPTAMVASSALAAMSVAAQGHVDVQRDAELVGPVSLEIVVVADSGERKTGCDRAFARAADEWSREKAKLLTPKALEAKEARAAHEAEKAGILGAIRDLSTRKSKKKSADATASEADLDELKRKLKDLATKAPPLLPSPTPMVENGTVEGVAKVLRDAWPSAAWWSNEGGAVTGGHGFTDDALVRTLAFLNSRWDGAAFDRARAAEDHSRTYGRRLTVSLMLQPAAFEALCQAGNGMARGLGTLARGLISWPSSTMGTRFRDPDKGDREMPALKRFQERAEELHELPLPMAFGMKTLEVRPDEKGAPPVDPLELKPKALKLDSTARRLWIGYLNETEREMAPDGELVTVRDVAAKSAENACRLAAIFHVWQHAPTGSIGAEDMGRGIEIARWFLYEARRILGEHRENPAAADAELLARWIKTRTDDKKAAPTLEETAQRAPYRLRNKARRDPALALLIEHHWVRQEKRDGKTTLVLNPKLPWEA
jgi:hypothetical protein